MEFQQVKGLIQGRNDSVGAATLVGQKPVHELFIAYPALDNHVLRARWIDDGLT